MRKGQADQSMTFEGTPEGLTWPSRDSCRGGESAGEVGWVRSGRALNSRGDEVQIKYLGECWFALHTRK